VNERDVRGAAKADSPNEGGWMAPGRLLTDSAPRTRYQRVPAGPSYGVRPYRAKALLAVLYPLRWFASVTDRQGRR
jgi:hypothetical protein